MKNQEYNNERPLNRLEAGDGAVIHVTAPKKKYAVIPLGTYHARVKVADISSKVPFVLACDEQPLLSGCYTVQGEKRCCGGGIYAAEVGKDASVHLNEKAKKSLHILDKEGTVLSEDIPILQTVRPLKLQSEKLEELRHTEGESKPDITRNIGIGVRYYNLLINGKNRLSDQSAKLLSLYYKVSVEWLIDDTDIRSYKKAKHDYLWEKAGDKGEYVLKQLKRIEDDLTQENSDPVARVLYHIGTLMENPSPEVLEMTESYIILELKKMVGAKE